jgi:hypothetical protein
MGRISKGIGIGLLIFGLWFTCISVPAELGSIRPNSTETTLLFWVVTIAWALLWRYLRQRWPQVFSIESMARGGPSLTAGKVMAGTTVILLWVCSIAALLSYSGLKSATVLAAVIVLTGVFLGTMNLLEKRWSRD